MSRFSSLLLPLDGSPEAAKGTGCALWLAQALDATLHVLHASRQPIEGRDALARLHVPNAQQPRVVLHQVAERADAAVLEALAAYDVDLVVMGARGESVSAGLKPFQRLGTVAQAVIEHCPVPVLLLPMRYREVLPWTSMLAAVSGETAADRVLATATHLAAALGLKVTVVHAADGPGAKAPLEHAAYVDAIHHEYPNRIDEMVEQGLAGCSPDECCRIDRVLVRRGDPAKVMLEQAASHDSSVLALGWHGALGAGRALVLKRLLEEAECALLLVRRMEKSTSRLKIGEELDD